MPLATRLRAPLTRRFQVTLAAIGAQSAVRMQAAWERLDSYDENQIDQFAELAAPTLSGAKGAAVRNAVGYYALLAGVRPVPVLANEVPVVANVREPFIATWQALSSGTPFADAVAAGSARAEAIVRNLITSSSIQTGDIVAQRAGLEVRGWERVPDAGACEWCLTVAPGFYTSAETADFGHDRCGCTTTPIFA